MFKKSFYADLSVKKLRHSDTQRPLQSLCLALTVVGIYGERSNGKGNHPRRIVSNFVQPAMSTGHFLWPDPAPTRRAKFLTQHDQLTMMPKVEFSKYCINIFCVAESHHHSKVYLFENTASQENTL